MKTNQMVRRRNATEEKLSGFEITIEPNPDTWRGGFIWSVSLGNQELDCGIERSRRIAENAANAFINETIVGVREF